MEVRSLIDYIQSFSSFNDIKVIMHDIEYNSDSASGMQKIPTLHFELLYLGEDYMNVTENIQKMNPMGMMSCTLGRDEFREQEARLSAGSFIIGSERDCPYVTFHFRIVHEGEVDGLKKIHTMFSKREVLMEIERL